MSNPIGGGDPEAVKLPTEENKGPSPGQSKIVRIFTVMVYFGAVSGAAVMLSLYYVFLWNPEPYTGGHLQQDDEVGGYVFAASSTTAAPYPDHQTTTTTTTTTPTTATGFLSRILFGGAQ